MSDIVETYRLVIPGPVGEEKVLKALLGPEIQVTQLVLNNFQVLKQPTLPKDVWNIMKPHWQDRYKGAYTMDYQEGATARVGCIEFTSRQAFEKAAKMIGDWDFHDMNWYRYES